MGRKMPSARYVPIIPPLYDPYAREKERARAKREEEEYFRELDRDYLRTQNREDSVSCYTCNDDKYQCTCMYD